MSGFYNSTENSILHGGSHFLYVTGGLPAPSALLGLDYAMQAEPFVNVPAKTGIDLKGLDYAYNAEPFVGNQ